jgi:hypothetical protein
MTKANKAHAFIATSSALELLYFGGFHIYHIRICKGRKKFFRVLIIILKANFYAVTTEVSFI